VTFPLAFASPPIPAPRSFPPTPRFPFPPFYLVRNSGILTLVSCPRVLGPSGSTVVDLHYRLPAGTLFPDDLFALPRKVGVPRWRARIQVPPRDDLPGLYRYVRAQSFPLSSMIPLFFFFFLLFTFEHISFPNTSRLSNPSFFFCPARAPPRLSRAARAPPLFGSLCSHRFAFLDQTNRLGPSAFSPEFVKRRESVE